MKPIENKLLMDAQCERLNTAPDPMPAEVRAAIPAGARRARLESARRAEERRQTLIFALVICIALGLGILALIMWRAGVEFIEKLWILPIAGAGIVMLFGPIIGYYKEENENDAQ